MTINPYYTSVFGAILDQEIADALKCGMSLEAIYAELAPRTRAVAEQLIRIHTAKEEVLCVIS